MGMDFAVTQDYVWQGVTIVLLTLIQAKPTVMAMGFGMRATSVQVQEFLTMTGTESVTKWTTVLLTLTQAKTMEMGMDSGMCVTSVQDRVPLTVTVTVYATKWIIVL